VEHRGAINRKSLTLLAAVLSALFLTIGVESAPAGATEKVSGQMLPDHDPHASLTPEDRWHKIEFQLFPHLGCSGYAFGDATEGSCEGYSEKGTDPYPREQQMMFRWDPWGQSPAHPRRLKITIRANNDYIYGVIDGPGDGALYYATDGTPGDLPFSHFTSKSGQNMVLRNPLVNEFQHESWGPPGERGGPLSINVARPDTVISFLDKRYELTVEGYLYW
jgi:hypothetical protein